MYFKMSSVITQSAISIKALNKIVADSILNLFIIIIIIMIIMRRPLTIISLFTL